MSSAVAETRTRWGVGLIAGYDSNPLLLTGDGPDGGFAELRLDGRVTRFVGDGATAAFFADGRLSTRLDPQTTAGAEKDTGDLRAGWVFSPAFAGHRLTFSGGAGLSAYRGTFIDRATGSAYETSVVPATDPPSTIPIPERLDFDSTELFCDVRFKQSRRLTWFVESATERTTYVEDYRGATSLDSLDYRALRVRPGARIAVGDAAALRVQVALTDLTYDDRPAVDKSGAVVPGTTREYRYAQYQVSLDVVPANAWKLAFAAATGGRDDTYAGYYDNVSRAALVSIDRGIGERSRLRLLATMRTLDYDRATVTGDPADGTLGSDERSYTARWTRDLGRRMNFYVESGTQRTDSEDPVFAYDRNWVLSGFRYGS